MVQIIIGDFSADVPEQGTAPAIESIPPKNGGLLGWFNDGLK